MWHIFFFFNRHCNPCGFWPAQLPLSILSTKVFYRVPLPAARQTPNLEDQWLERSNSRHQVSPTSEMTQANPSSGRWNYGRENCREFCQKWRLPCHFWVLLHAVNLWHGTDGFTFPPNEGVQRIFLPEKSDSFSRVWTCELGYQRPARLPLDHRSRSMWHVQSNIIKHPSRILLNGNINGTPLQNSTVSYKLGKTLGMVAVFINLGLHKKWNVIM